MNNSSISWHPLVFQFTACKQPAVAMETVESGFKPNRPETNVQRQRPQQMQPDYNSVAFRLEDFRFDDFYDLSTLMRFESFILKGGLCAVRCNSAF
jgi:hypothetical protein